MTAEHRCPACGESFDTAGALRDHAWASHGACHYCGRQIADVGAGRGDDPGDARGGGADADAGDDRGSDDASGPDREPLYVHWLTAHGDRLAAVDRKRARAAVGEVDFADRLEHLGTAGALRGVSRRTTLAALGLGLAGAGAAAVGAFGDGGTADGGRTAPGSGGGGGSAGGGAGEAGDGSVPIPPAPGNHRYAVAGTGEADATATYVGAWKCPYCARFSTGFLETIIAEYVRPGDLDLRFRALTYVDGRGFLGSDAPAAGRAGLAVWDSDPGAYWRYHHHVFANQPPEGRRWATADRLVAFAREAGVDDPGVVRTAIEEGRYERRLRRTTEMANSTGVQGTPALVVDGRVVSPLDEAATRRALDRAVGRGGEP